VHKAQPFLNKNKKENSFFILCLSNCEHFNHTINQFQMLLEQFCCAQSCHWSSTALGSSCVHFEQKNGGNALCWAMTKAMTNARGPREPWHDLHCKIEAQAACDILTHIKQHRRKARWWHTTDVIQFKRIQWILSPSANIPPEGHPKLYMTNYNEP
jgi:hypothetical protein